MSQKRAEKLLRRAKRQRRRAESRKAPADQRFEDALKITEVICKHGGVVHDDKTGEVTKVEPHVMEAYRAGRLREALQEHWRLRT